MASQKWDARTERVGVFLHTNNMLLSILFKTFNVNNVTSLLEEEEYLRQAIFTSVHPLKIVADEDAGGTVDN